MTYYFLSMLFLASSRNVLKSCNAFRSSFISSTNTNFITNTKRQYSKTTTLNMKLQTAIVGLPNVGKSTLFNALTESQGAEAANYPFCTIEPNVGIVEVPDPRLKKLEVINESVKVSFPFKIGSLDINLYHLKCHVKNIFIG